MKKTYHLSWFVVGDWIAAFVAWLVFFDLRKRILAEESENLFQFHILAGASIVSFFWVCIYLFSGLYKEVFRKSRTKESFQLIGVNLIGATIIFFTLLLDDQGVRQYTAYYKTFGLYYGIQTLFSVWTRIVIISSVKQRIRNKNLYFNTLLIGSGKSAEEIYTEVNENHQLLGLKFIGFVRVDDYSEDLLNKKLRNFGTLKTLTTAIRRCRVEHVIIAVEKNEEKSIQYILNVLEGSKIKIGIIPDIYQLIIGSVKVNQLLGIPLIEVNQDLIPLWQQTLKRGIDIAVSIFILIFGLPFFLIIASFTRFTSPGPIFYMQERVGKDGKPFQIIKFRSMKVNAETEGPALASKLDDRITSWGKWMRRFRLDELPQFYNVLIGDMSLVGPRPERKFFIDQIVQVAPEYLHLQKVRPGLTSLGQVKFGYAENLDEMVKRLKYDILYIENMSLAMDFRILLYTILIILQGRGK